MRRETWLAGWLLAALGLATPCARTQQRASGTPAPPAAGEQMDRDLMEISVPALERLYAQHRYTVTQVTQWYLARIARYDGTYRALLHVDSEGALKRAAEEDAEPKNARRGLLWGVPIVVKANTSVKGW